MAMATADIAALGTTARIVALNGRKLEAAMGAVRLELEAIDRACSRFRPDSELSRVNEAGGAPVSIGPLLREALQAALRASCLTDGIVDPTVGEALVRAGYDRDFAAVPRQGCAVPRIFRPSPGFQVVQLNPAASTVRLPAGVRLDLGATAKALAADRAAAAAAQAAGCGVLVSLGGDVAVAGAGPAGGWTIRVTDDCHAGPDAPGQTVAIVSGGLATSSTTVRRWSRGGATLHHIIHPSTGLPAKEHWRSVSVAAASCLDANIAATAAIVLGSRASDWLSERQLPARLIGTDGTVMTAAGWPADDTEEELDAGSLRVFG